jgi:hypothetical protein
MRAAITTYSPLVVFVLAVVCAGGLGHALGRKKWETSAAWGVALLATAAIAFVIFSH